jgi:arylsulfatase A-like enzyme
LRAGKGSLYEGGHRVAGIFRWKGHIQPGLSNATTMTMDLLPTIADLAGAEMPSNLDGVSLKPLILDKKELDQRKLFWQYTHSMAMRHGKWKLVYLKNGAKTELYDLDADIGETTNLKEQHPEVADKMLKELLLWYKNVTKGTAKKS